MTEPSPPAIGTQAHGSECLCHKAPLFSSKFRIKDLRIEVDCADRRRAGPDLR